MLGLQVPDRFDRNNIQEGHADQHDGGAICIGFKGAAARGILRRRTLTAASLCLDAGRTHHITELVDVTEQYLCQLFW